MFCLRLDAHWFPQGPNQLPMCNENSLRLPRSSGRNAIGCASLWPSLDISASISSRPLPLSSVALNHCKTNFSLSCFQLTWICSQFMNASCPAPWLRPLRRHELGHARIGIYSWGGFSPLTPKRYDVQVSGITRDGEG